MSQGWPTFFSQASSDIFHRALPKGTTAKQYQMKVARRILSCVFFFSSDLIWIQKGIWGKSAEKEGLKEGMDKLSEACLDSKTLPNPFKFGCSAGVTKAKIGFLDAKRDLTMESVLVVDLQENKITVHFLPICEHWNTSFFEVTFASFCAK